jgi:hypothetical protein
VAAVVGVVVVRGGATDVVAAGGSVVRDDTVEAGGCASGAGEHAVTAARANVAASRAAGNVRDRDGIAGEDTGGVTLVR